MSQFDRSKLMSLAKTCRDNCRYEDVISFMKKVIKICTPFNFGERGLLLDSYQQLKQPYLYSFDDSSLDEKLQREINLKAKSKQKDYVTKLFSC